MPWVRWAIGATFDRFDEHGNRDAVCSGNDNRENVSTDRRLARGTGLLVDLNRQLYGFRMRLELRIDDPRGAPKARTLGFWIRHSDDACRSDARSGIRRSRRSCARGCNQHQYQGYSRSHTGRTIPRDAGFPQGLTVA